MTVPGASGSDLASLVLSMKGQPVLVAGDIMLDRFVTGQVERISPESPVPVLTITREDRMLGGAGNALANLAALGATGFVLSVVGDDAEGVVVREKAQSLGLNCEGLLIDASRPTTVKTRFMAGHQQLLRSDFERSHPVSDSMLAQLQKYAQNLLPRMKALIISDYGKGLLRPDLIAALIKAARELGLPVIVDPKGADFSIYQGATAITPNRKELEAATRDMPTKTDADIITASLSLIKECGLDAVVATRSRDGLSVISHTAPPLHLPGAEIEVFDVSGAGDTVIATIGAALAAGASLQQAAGLANLAGSVVVTKVGTAPIYADELILALQEDDAERLCGAATNTKTLAHQGEIQSADTPLMQATEQVKRWRARGLKVGFTNGCFDVLHAGHVSYLAQARKRCDRLVVGLNTDSSVRVLKGPDRPVHDEKSRAAVLGALQAVDMVVLFGAAEAGQDNTAISLLKSLQPDVYFKGGDYTEAQIPEAPTVRAYGGIVDIMPVYDGHSSSNSIKKIKGKAA
jgi:D-beta-D-heptose 7-phosphate kinase/D-beta-D-heptose 1-phosphate adenosyltransferase